MTAKELNLVFWQLKKAIDDEIMSERDKKTLVRSLTIIFELAEKALRREQSVFYGLCFSCKTEIDLRKGGTYHSEGTFLRHNICPPLKPDAQRKDISK